MPEVSAFADRLGGRWAISLRAWLVVAAVLVSQVVLVVFSEAPSRAAQAVALGIIAIAVGAVGGVLAIGGRWVLRGREVSPARPGTVIGVYAASGVAAFVVVSAGYRIASAYPSLDVSPLTATISVVTGVLAIPIITGTLVGCALAFDEYDRLRRRQSVLTSRLGELDDDEEVRTALARSVAASVEREIAEATDTVRGDLARARGDMTPAERAALIVQLNQTLSATVRPLAERLASHHGQPVGTRGETLRMTFERGTLRPGVVTALIVVIIFLFLLNRHGLGYATAQALSQIPVTYLPLAAIVWLQRRSFIPRLWTVPLAVAVSSIGIVVKTAVLQDQLLGEVVVGRLAQGAFWVSTVVLLTSVVSTAYGARREEIRQLEDEVDDRLVAASRANREVARVSRELAQYVHGTLQSTLLATAFALERANEADDPAAFAAAASAASVALAEAPQVRREAASLAHAIARQRELWGDFTEIDCEVVGRIDPTGEVLRSLELVLEEGIANAKKHGRSTHIGVVIDRVPEGIRIRISDNGAGPSAGVPGYGSSLLDRAAPGAWELRPAGETGSVLTAVVSA